ncbi:hypothetical protein BDZ91DRAFT_685855 [Kalaharituber pfeilii]|nr:hypothetical protein BDZ91DRAFT_685855 [Kalaharituber pfeilii]
MSAPPADVQDTASHPKRDRDLLVPDDVLTDNDFDNLWDWFASAVETNVDRQLIFAKLVNSARNPYLNQCRLNLTANLFLSPTGTSYTPTKCTITAHTPGDPQPHDDGALKDLNSQFEGLKGELRHARAELATKDKEIHMLKTKVQTVSPSSAPRVAIMSVKCPDNFVQMDGSEVSSHTPDGSGSVGVQPHVAWHETFELEYYPDSIFAFKSTCFENVYLRATCDPRKLFPGDRKTSGGGVVNCQYISGGPGRCSIQEKFRIYHLGWRGWVAIEPLAFPGRYLSLDAEKRTVTLQGVRDEQERFCLVFIAS